MLIKTPARQRIAVAPMMQWTDRHFRYLLRKLSRHSFLYTEMVTTGAILYGNRLDLLRYHPDEHPIVLQLGGSDPVALASCAVLAENRGFDQVNINVGCPSDRVQSGRFGACLFKEPDLVAQCVAAMTTAVAIPITVKTRIGVDELDSYEALHHFVRSITDAGCSSVILHARKAWLKGLSPKENREIPPLCYETVYQLKRDFPKVEIILNGGVDSLEQMQRHLEQVDGVMLGRSVYHNPMVLSGVDRAIYVDDLAGEPLSPSALLQAYQPYMIEELQAGTAFSAMARHFLGLFQTYPGARAWRRYLTEHMHEKGAGIDVLEKALTCFDLSYSSQI